MSKKQLIGLAAYNSTEKIGTANWTNRLSEPVALNQGDTIQVKASFVDTRNSISGNIVIEEDTTISLDYYFYYVNRGGTGLKSGIPSTDYRFDPLFPDRQITCLEFVESRNSAQMPGIISPALNTFSNPNDQGNPKENPGISTSVPVSWSASGNQNNLPVTDDITATGKTSENLSPLVESIHHCYSSATIPQAKIGSLSFSSTAISTINLTPGTVYKIASVGSSNWAEISGNKLLMPISLAGPIFTCVAPEEEPAGILITDVLPDPGIDNTIANLGRAWDWSFTSNGVTTVGYFDTNWVFFGVTGEPTLGQSFTRPTEPPMPFYQAFSNDPSNLPNFSAFYTANGYDLSQIGGAPPTHSGPGFSLYDYGTNTWPPINPNQWYSITGGLTPEFIDGSQIPYASIFGALGQEGGYILTADSSFVTDDTIPDITAYVLDETYFFKLAPGQQVRCLNLGNYDWTFIGPTSDQIENGPPFNFTVTQTPVPDPNTPTTDVQFFVIPTEVLHQYDSVTDVEIIATNSSLTTDVINAQLLIETAPTGAYYPPPDFGTAFPQVENSTEHNLFNNTELFTNTIDYNAADGMPYILSYASPTNPVDGSKTYNPAGMDPGDCVPFIKRWEMTLKKGSYQPDYLAQIITRAMSTQKEKINVPSTVTNKTSNFKYLATPIAGIGSQLYDSTLNPFPVGKQIQSSTTFNGSAVNMYIGIEWASTGGTWPFRSPNLSQGPFPYTSGTAGERPTGPYDPNVDPATYQPSLFYASKNPEIMPKGNVIPNKLPVNPKYYGQDFNNPKLGYKDDQAFIYRPNAYVTQTPRSIETNEYGLAFDTPIGSIKNAEIVPHLMYNDANLDNFNNMPAFGKNYDSNLKAIPMMYRPFISDSSSNWFNKVQFDNNVTVGNDYAIIPVISNSIFGLSGVAPMEDADGTQAHLSCYTYNGSLEVSTPLVGAPEMNLSFNVENTNLFSFENLHTSIFVKPDAQTMGVQASTALIPTAFNDFTETDVLPGIGVVAKSWTIPAGASADGISFFAPTIEEISIIATWIGGTAEEDYQYSLSPAPGALFAGNPGWTGNPPYTSYIQIDGSVLNGLTGVNDLTILLVTDGTGNVTSSSLTGTPAKFTQKSVRSLPAVQQLSAQSGIIFADMTAVTSSGKKVPFWESLGFNVNQLCKKYNPSAPSDPFMTLEEFYQSTTRDFSGSANNYDPTIITAGSNEQSYISYIDSLSLLGWYTAPTFNLSLPVVNANPDPPSPDDYIEGAGQGITSFTLQNKIIYNTVDSTLGISGNIPYVDLTDGGHYLISIDGYKGSLITDKGVLNCKTIISTYYQAANAFVINSEPDSAIYEHIGESLILSSIKVRIIDPITGLEVQNLGGNSSVYLEVTRNLSKDTTSNTQLTNTE